MKPLFIPLCKKPYEEFEAGLKTVEWRIAGKRWNANTCTIGRPVVLSCGYGKKRRLHGFIESLEICFVHDPDHIFHRFFGDKTHGKMAAQIGIRIIYSTN